MQNCEVHGCQEEGEQRGEGGSMSAVGVHVQPHENLLIGQAFPMLCHQDVHTLLYKTFRIEEKKLTLRNFVQNSKFHIKIAH